MKHISHLMITFAAAALMACNGNGNSDMNDSTMADNNLCPAGYDSFCALQDVPQTMPADLFKGQNDELLDQLLPDGQAEASINTFLLRGKGRVILFDAGLGASRGGQLLAHLDSLGINPSDVTDICITHFHFDHIGGLTDDQGNAVFANARLHASQVEYEAYTTGELSADNGMVLAVVNAYKDRLNLFAQGDTILEDIHTIAAPGHTPGHTLYRVDKILVAGDIMHAVSLQLEHPEFCARFDYNHEQAVLSRRQILECAEKQHLVVAGMHFPGSHIICF